MIIMNIMYISYLVTRQYNNSYLKLCSRPSDEYFVFIYLDENNNPGKFSYSGNEFSQQ